jgi:dsDNA-specific endonuclease/ATPase MutS2
MKDAAETLEFHKIQSEVASFAHTEIGQEKANALAI